MAHRNIRFRGIGGGESPDSPEIVALSEIPFDLVESYDRLYFPEHRTSFLQGWLTQTGHIALGVWDGETLRGYGVVRPCHSGYKIGPLFAEDRAIAEQVFLALKAKVPENEPVFLDIPEPNAAGLAIASKYNMTAEFETARMYIGSAPDLPLKTIFGITTFELG